MLVYCAQYFIWYSHMIFGPLFHLDVGKQAANQEESHILWIYKTYVMIHFNIVNGLISILPI